MKVYIITYYVGEGSAGVNSVWKSKTDAETRFECCIRDTFDDSGEPERVVKSAVEEALKTGHHDHTGDGSDDNAWYELSEEEVQ